MFSLATFAAGEKFQQIAAGWKVTKPDGTEIYVTSDDIKNSTGDAAGTFPPGTKIEPAWVDKPVGTAPDGMTGPQADEYNNIEHDHRTGLDMSDFLTAWSCKNGDLYQFIIFDLDPERDGFGYVFYGSGTSYDAAKAKAKEAQDDFAAGIEAGDPDSGIHDEDDCLTGYASITTGSDSISINLMNPFGYLSDTAKNIVGEFYMSQSGEIVARPEQSYWDGTNLDKIGFKWEYGPKPRPLPQQ